MPAVLCIMVQPRGSSGSKRNGPCKSHLQSIHVIDLDYELRVPVSCDPTFTMWRDRRRLWVFEGLTLAADFQAGRLAGSARERLSVPTASREASN